MELASLLDGLTPENWTTKRLTDGQGHYCALGWMLHKSGVDNTTLQNFAIDYTGMASSYLQLDIWDTNVVININDRGFFYAGPFEYEEIGPGSGSSFQERINAIRNYLGGKK